MSLAAQTVVRPLTRTRSYRKVGRTAGTYLILTAILIFAVFPFVWTLAIALTDKTSGSSIYDFPSSLFPKRITLANFVNVFQNFSLGRYIGNSISITFWTVLGTLVVSALAAYPLARFKFPGRDLIFGVIVATLVLPGETNFLVNTLTLKQFSLLGTHAGVVLPTVAGAFGIFLMRQAFLSIPTSLLEAARLDGAGEGAVLTKIMLPLSRPALAALGIFTLVSTWNAYLWPSLALSGNDELLPLSVGILKLKGQFNYDPFNVAAGALFMMIPVLLVFLGAQRLFMKGLEGAVK
jgi:putative chitobiose transport system permease protein